MKPSVSRLSRAVRFEGDLHQCHKEQLENPGAPQPPADRVRLGTDVLQDVYLALRCQKFIGLGMPKPSCIISVLKNWCEGDCILLGPSLLRPNFAGNNARLIPQADFLAVLVYRAQVRPTDCPARQ
jgi:hypothetical protein